MSKADRHAKRLAVESVVLPFLGSRAEDYQSFEYLLQDVSVGGVGIAIPRWVVARETLRQGERLHLHLPFELGGRMLHSGVVTWVRWDEEQESQLAGVLLDTHTPALYPVYVSVGTREVAIDLEDFPGLEHILSQVLKDSLLLKRGILVYLKHLTAFFSRVCDLNREEYALFREVVIEDVRAKVLANAERLEIMQPRSGEEMEGTLARLDLSELRQAMEPELYVDMFRAALGDETVILFLKAVKELERKLLSNYNTCVLLYINSL
ncbi:MAG: PilZ domain-containing protein [Proteobacteria bacterium]|nr:PilZ domain-containing protein [Pseudomonadota bacterium]